MLSRPESTTKLPFDANKPTVVAPQRKYYKPPECIRIGLAITSVGGADATDTDIFLGPQNKSGS